MFIFIVGTPVPGCPRNTANPDTAYGGVPTGFIVRQHVLVRVAVKIDIAFYLFGVKGIMVYGAFIAFALRLHSIAVTFDLQVVPHTNRYVIFCIVEPVILR